MTHHVSKSEFQAKALEFFRRVEESGEPIVVTDNSIPRIEVRRFTISAKPDALQTLRGTVLRYDEPFEPVGLEDWEALR